MRPADVDRGSSGTDGGISVERPEVVLRSCDGLWQGVRLFGQGAADGVGPEDLRRWGDFGWMSSFQHFQSVVRRPCT